MSLKLIDSADYPGGGGDSGYPGYYETIAQMGTRMQMEADRDYGLKAQQIKQTAQRIAIEKGTAEATAWYNRQMVGLAKDKLKEDQRQFNVTSSGYLDNGNPTLNRENVAAGYTGYWGSDPTLQRIQLESGLTGDYQGAPTWAKTKDISALTGDYGGLPTWAKQQALAELTGDINGTPTWARQYQTAGLTGELEGAPTLAKSFGEAGLTGYYGGNPTLARENQQNNQLFQWTQAALEAGQRPEDWVKLRRMQNAYGTLTDFGRSQAGPGAQTFAGSPQPGTLGSVMGKMNLGGNWAADAANQAAQTPTLSPEEQQLHQTAHDFGTSPWSAAPGWWESQDPLTQKLIKGAGESQGLDWASVLAKYGASQWGAGSPSAMAA